MAAVIFLILFVVTRSAGYFRGQWSVADSERSGTEDVKTSAAIGVTSGVTVLIFLVLLYAGITRWDWAGHPVGGVHAVSTPAPVATPANPVVPATTPGAAASPSKTP